MPITKNGNRNFYSKKIRQKIYKNPGQLNFQNNTAFVFPNKENKIIFYHFSINMKFGFSQNYVQNNRDLSSFRIINVFIYAQYCIAIDWVGKCFSKFSSKITLCEYLSF